MSGNGSWLTVPLRERDGQGRKGRRGAGWRALQANRPAKSGTGFSGTQARSLSRAERHPMIDRLNKHLSLTRQCQLLGLCRSSLYYQPAPDNTEDLVLMARIDRQFLETPYYGSRKMTAWLRREGHVVNRKRVRRVIRQMGLQVIWQKPNTSKPNPEHKVYPYLLRGLTIDRPNQVWATDITYIPMPKGFFYLVAIMDWHSRKVLSWRLSNTMDAIFCVEALEEALALYGRPEIFNSDQGAQFTIHRRAGGRRRPDQHGRQLHGQCFRGAPVAQLEI